MEYILSLIKIDWLIQKINHIIMKINDILQLLLWLSKRKNNTSMVIFWMQFPTVCQNTNGDKFNSLWLQLNISIFQESPWTYQTFNIKFDFSTMKFNSHADKKNLNVNYHWD